MLRAQFWLYLNLKGEEGSRRPWAQQGLQPVTGNRLSSRPGMVRHVTIHVIHAAVLATSLRIASVTIAYLIFFYSKLTYF